MQNPKTTILGVIAVLTAALSADPSLVNFLPPAWQTYVIGIARLVAVLSGCKAFYHAQDATPSDPASAGNIQSGPALKASPSVSPIAPIVPLLAVALALATLAACTQLQKLESQPIVQEAARVVGPEVLKAAASEASSEISTLNKSLGGNASTAAAVQQLATSASTALYASMTASTPPTASSVESAVLTATEGQLPATAAAIANAYANSAAGQNNATLASLATLVSSLGGTVPGGTVAAAVAKVTAP